ncbi:transposase, partial [uncultured Nonlabens sp.]|uniref:transposase n=1 Tax=uncultured Nonlabens sp. TaxID=859306 RepID=UPI002622BA65
MAKPKEFLITESFEELKKLRKQHKDLNLAKRVLWLIYLKEKKFKTRVELCDYLDIVPKTEQRWSKRYRLGGIEELLNDKSKVRKSKLFSPEVHKALEDRLNLSENGFLGYWDAQQWVNENFDL